ncbi:unnamed protein product [Linum tenue]|uniref:Uncharacterized protein n=1 Tax=Linum tenue TaxID=586396 RepID=A0AAV0PGK0_9ROSI|nr:unnamed protein product [Linum tenue]
MSLMMWLTTKAGTIAGSLFTARSVLSFLSACSVHPNFTVCRSSMFCIRQYIVGICLGFYCGLALLWIRLKVVFFNCYVLLKGIRNCDIQIQDQC